ncbi:phage integrase N-terminal domain-containing protein [Porticoccus sp. GXU_MW_L64]
MQKLNYELKQLCKTNRDGSHSTRSTREANLQKMANDLHKLGFRGMRARSLKQKHVDALVKQYQQEGINPRTLKNRLSYLRWWADKIGRPQVVARSNSHYDIQPIQYKAVESKAQNLDQQQLNRIDDPHIKISLELQATFGLRREESIKFIPSYADQQDHIILKATWCKGGKARIIPIENHQQRDVLNRAHQLAGNGSLIPRHLSYVQQMRRYEKQTAKAGFHKLHGLRHAYAQAKYLELTGWPAPVCGGPTKQQLTTEQREIDRQARLAVSKLLGHEREQITQNYLS